MPSSLRSARVRSVFLHGSRAALFVALAMAGCGGRTPFGHADAAGSDGGVSSSDAAVDAFGADAFTSDAGPVECVVASDCPDDGLVCNGVVACDLGRCVTEPAPDCSDGIDCTVDRCDEMIGCAFVPDSSRCGDGATCVAGAGCVTCSASAPFEIDCQNGVDDDCDGQLDCEDADCADSASCSCIPRTMTEVNCFDASDDDCDGQLDCDDSDCATLGCACAPVAGSEVACDDGLDDDCNGLVDCNDPVCAGTTTCSCIPTSPVESRCRDGVDNDCDGQLDCADPECAATPLCSTACMPTGIYELGVEACTNGLDDDCDGTSDCSDLDCRPAGAEGECCDGTDDNGNGTVDEFTCRCESNDDCAGVGSLSQVCWASTYSFCAPRCNTLGGSRFCRSIGLTSCDRTTGECL